MNQIFHVTRDDIKLGRKGSAIFCPIAVCLSNATGTSWFVYFVHSRNAIGKWYDNSDALRDWIADFDKGKEVNPIEIWVNDETLQIGKMPDSVKLGI
jgi:hypothetical protein